MDPQGPTGLWSNAGVDVFIRIPWNWSDPRGAGQYKDWERGYGRLGYANEKGGNFNSRLFLLWLACALAIQMSLTGKAGLPAPAIQDFASGSSTPLPNGQQPDKGGATEAGRAHVGALDGSPGTPRARGKLLLGCEPPHQVAYRPAPVCL